MDTRMLDVAIGLALVFAMFSLVVTTVQEAHAGIRNNRGKNFERLVCSFTGDNSALAQAILAHPFLQTMAMELPSGKQRPPSYLESDVFVTGLLAYLTSYTAGLRPASPTILVQELKGKLPLDPKQEFVSNLSALLPGVENDWPAFEKRLQAWFEAVGERSSGWYKRKTQARLFVYAFILAFALNVNPVVIATALWRDAALRTSVVAQADIALRAYQTQTGEQPAPGGTPQRALPAAAKAVAQAYTAVDKQLATIRLALESINVPTNAALSNGGAQEVLNMRRMALEMRAALTLERDTTNTDPKVQRQREDAPATFDFRLSQLRELIPVGASKDGTCRLADKFLCPVAKQLEDAITALKAGIDVEREARPIRAGDADAAAILGAQCLTAKDLSAATVELCKQLKQLGIFEQSGIPLGWTDENWPRVFRACRAEEAQDVGIRCKEPVPWQLSSVTGLLNWLVVIGGWAITAIGATLGAPFWFDLLGRLVKLRSSGVKPAETGGAAAPNATPTPSTLTPGSATAGDATASTPSRDAFNDAERLLSDDEIIRIQRNLGMPAAQQSGRIDLATRTAVSAWQSANGANATGELTQVQIQQLILNPTTLEDDGYVG